jgi:hypothetical protein
MTASPTRVAAPRPTDRPASYGEPLGAVLQPPPDTLVLVASAVSSVGAAYDTAFAPYGYASREGDGRGLSNGAGADGLVVKVISSTARAGTGSGLVLSDRNLLVGLTAATRGKVATGGLYMGTVVFVRSGDGLVPILTAVAVASRH